MTHRLPDGVGINLSMGDSAAPRKERFGTVACVFCELNISSMCNCGMMYGAG